MENNLLLNIKDKIYQVIDTKEKVTIADSFVIRQNKIGGGNGEAKLYVGNDNIETRNFFGYEGFKIQCYLLKTDLINYLNETKEEYLNPEQPYINKNILPKLWKERLEKINRLEDVLEFEVKEQTQIKGVRVYVNSSDGSENNYNIIRELSLPNISYITIVKLIDSNGENKFYFRLFADYFGDDQHPFAIKKEIDEIEQTILSKPEKDQLIRARVGQGEYRRKLLDLCPFCPLTLISDERLLIASHIKPWVNSNDFEKTDPKNGFMFTPTIDKLFDRGFISFSSDKKLLLSPFLSNMTYSKLSLSNNKSISMLPIEGRELYLNYHREFIFKK